jgi:hypothetical protein
LLTADITVIADAVETVEAIETVVAVELWVELLRLLFLVVSALSA